MSPMKAVKTANNYLRLDIERREYELAGAYLGIEQAGWTDLTTLLTLTGCKQTGGEFLSDADVHPVAQCVGLEQENRKFRAEGKVLSSAIAKI